MAKLSSSSAKLEQWSGAQERGVGGRRHAVLAAVADGVQRILPPLRMVASPRAAKARISAQEAAVPPVVAELRLRQRLAHSAGEGGWDVYFTRYELR